ncbi:MAG: hypothetical protein HQK49_05295 [Oligoflexia bacterium]|nr:hypothetical protein [Oligoflexia bacterium]
MVSLKKVFLKGLFLFTLLLGCSAYADNFPGPGGNPGSGGNVNHHPGFPNVHPYPPHHPNPYPNPRPFPNPFPNPYPNPYPQPYPNPNPYPVMVTCNAQAYDYAWGVGKGINIYQARISAISYCEMYTSYPGSCVVLNCY